MFYLVRRSFCSPLYFLCFLLVSVFHLFCLLVFTLLLLFFSMSGIPRGIDHIETLVWILSGTMSITFRRTRRRTYIRMALNMSSKRRRIRGALDMPYLCSGTFMALIRPTFLCTPRLLCVHVSAQSKLFCLLQSSCCTLFLFALSLSQSGFTLFVMDQQIQRWRR